MKQLLTDGDHCGTKYKKLQQGFLSLRFKIIGAPEKAHFVIFSIVLGTTSCLETDDLRVLEISEKCSRLTNYVGAKRLRYVAVENLNFIWYTSGMYQWNCLTLYWVDCLLMLHLAVGRQF